MKNPKTVTILHYTLTVIHPEYGKDVTSRYYFGCTYEEGLEIATKDLDRAGWKILNHKCSDFVAVNPLTLGL